MSSVLPEDWTIDRNRSEFLRWLDVLYRLINDAPTTWGTWQQTRDYQEILGVLARRLGFTHGPIERRKEAFAVPREQSRELHQREYVVVTDPRTNSVVERFDGWVQFPDTFPCSIRGVRGGMDETGFRQEVLERLLRWKQAVEAGT